MGKKLDRAIERIDCAITFRRKSLIDPGEYHMGVTAGMEAALRMCREMAGDTDDPPPKGDWTTLGNYRVIVW